MNGNVPDADDNEPEHECPNCGSTNTEPSAETRLEYKCRDCETAFDLSGSI
jgi:DNA-directed RNA polymerase subunit RPC12/RpoP